MKRLMLVLFLVALGFGPAHSSQPFNPDRDKLYTREELWTGFHPVIEKDKSYDGQIFNYFDRASKYAPPLDELRQQRKHDAGIEHAVNDFLGIDERGFPKKKVVVIMGSHSRDRHDPWYGRVSRLTYALSKHGYFVASGGGPGLMEAAHLGAYMAKSYSAADLETALPILASSEKPSAGKKQYQMPDWWDVALQVTRKFPAGGDSLGIPTWFYGHEGANAFTLQVAKFLSNSLREEKMCAIGVHGVIFAPGGPGTMQEIFMDAAENAYHSYNSFSPMVFFSESEDSKDPADAKEGKKARAMSDLVKQASSPEYLAQNMFLISATPAQIVEFLDAHPPVYSPYR